jgi:uncharacterized protein
MKRSSSRASLPLSNRLITALLALLLLLVPATGAAALALSDLPEQAPNELVIDNADVLSRASRTEIERQLQTFRQERVDARLLTVNRLDYGLTLPELGRQLLERWDGESRLLLLIDTQTKMAAIVASPALERRLPAALLRSTARTTMAQPLRDGDRYRQASLDGLGRLAAVLGGGEDPGEPLEAEVTVAASTIPTQEETRNSNAFTWIVVLLVVGTIVPMLTWWVFSR